MYKHDTVSCSQCQYVSDCVSNDNSLPNTVQYELAVLPFGALLATAGALSAPPAAVKRGACLNIVVTESPCTLHLGSEGRICPG
jgi:hypothetical protein